MNKCGPLRQFTGEEAKQPQVLKDILNVAGPMGVTISSSCQTPRACHTYQIEEYALAADIAPSDFNLLVSVANLESSFRTQVPDLRDLKDIVITSPKLDTDQKVKQMMEQEL